MFYHHRTIKKAMLPPKFIGFYWGIKCVVWSANEEQLITAGEDNRIVIWECSNSAHLTKILVLNMHSGIPLSMRWSPTQPNDVILSSSLDTSLIKWDITKFNAKQAEKKKQQQSNSVDKNESTVVAVDAEANGDDQQAPETAKAEENKQENDTQDNESNDAKSKKKKETMEDLIDTVVYKAHWSAVTDCAWSPDATNFVSVSDDYRVKLWDISQTEKEIKEYNLNSGVKSCDWSIGNEIAIIDDHANVIIMQADNLTVKNKVITPFPSMCRYSPDGNFLAVACRGGIHLFNTSEYMLTAILSNKAYKDEDMHYVSWSSNGQSLVATTSKAILVFDVNTARLEHIVKRIGQMEVNAAELSPSGNSIAAVYKNGSLTIWKKAHCWREELQKYLSLVAQSTIYALLLCHSNEASPLSLVPKNALSRIFTAIMLLNTKRGGTNFKRKKLDIVCKFWKSGDCKHGSNCRYLHNWNNSPAKIANRAYKHNNNNNNNHNSNNQRRNNTSNNDANNQKRKDTPCPYFKLGNCRFDNKCKYSHNK